MEPACEGTCFREANSAYHSPALVANLSICGVLIPQSEVLFNVRIIHTDARTYCDCSPRDVLSAAESDKKKKYVQACSARRVLFTLLCSSVDGMMGKEASVLVKKLAE